MRGTGRGGASPGLAAVAFGALGSVEHLPDNDCVYERSHQPHPQQACLTQGMRATGLRRYLDSQLPGFAFRGAARPVNASTVRTLIAS